MINSRAHEMTTDILNAWISCARKRKFGKIEKNLMLFISHFLMLIYCKFNDWNDKHI